MHSVTSWWSALHSPACAGESLREEGFDGTITLVGAEHEIPYDRPPLSKKVLAGEWEVERIRLRKADDFESLALALRLGVRATALDTHARTLSLDDGTTVVYDGLILATGASPRRLPDQPLLAGVVELRTLADSVDLRDRIAGGTARVTVIGAGFIGLEVAATARALGCAVTVLEGALPAHPWARRRDGCRGGRRARSQRRASSLRRAGGEPRGRRWAGHRRAIGRRFARRQ